MIVADPTPEQIHRACEAIQSQWTPTERLRRLVVHDPPAEVQIVAAETFYGARDDGE